MKTNKTNFFKLLRKAALQNDQPTPGKSPRKRGDCTRNCAEGWGMTEIDACMKIRNALSLIPKESV
jgi:hypothetical protein